MIRLLYASIILANVALLSACDSSSRYDDLRQQMDDYSKQVKAESAKIDTAEVPPIEPVSYQRSASRSPFASKDATDSTHAATGGNLLGYPTTSLRFVGMIELPGSITAVIETPDKKIYEVVKGDRIGSHHGKIANIYPDRLEVKEPISKDDPALGSRTVVLKLKDAR